MGGERADGIRNFGVSLERAHAADADAGPNRDRLNRAVDLVYAHPEDQFLTIDPRIIADCTGDNNSNEEREAPKPEPASAANANKLATGAWYLLMPPLNSHLNPINEATLPQWYQTLAFDSAEACEATKLQR